MQDFYGDQPFILQTKSKKEGRSGKKIRRTGNGKALVILLLVTVAIIFFASYYAYQRVFTVKIQQATYYAVCFYDGDSRTEAESVRSNIIAAGGSGYIVNGESFRVYGAVYKSFDEAQSVASKHLSGAKVEQIGWNSLKITCSDSKSAEELRAVWEIFCEAVDTMVALSVEIDSFESSEASVYAFAQRVYGQLYELSGSVLNEKASDFSITCARIIKDNLLDGSEAKMTSRLKFTLHELIIYAQSAADSFK